MLPVNPKEVMQKLSQAVKPIEYFVKKAEDKIPDKSFGGLFYAMIVLFLLCLFATLVILAIIYVGKFFPDDYKWIILPIIFIILGGLLRFFLHIVDNTNKKKSS